jgi:lysophospholipase L1-like esterase
VVVRCFPSGESFIVLADSQGEEVRLGAEGFENLFPAVQYAPDGFHILWVLYREGQTGLGLYDSRTAESRVVLLPGFSFAGSPRLIEQGGLPAGLVFLGNASDNDDVFLFDLGSGSLANVTRTAWSEKEFFMEPGAQGLLLRTVGLREVVLYSLSPGASSFRRLGRGSPRNIERRAGHPSADVPDCRPANTFAAFGDSITWGKMRMLDLVGEYHPELAYPERMKELLAPFYGPAYPINLGVPGETTYDGALRVYLDLADIDALYFALMMGTNDCIRNEFSTDSTIENLAYILAAASEKGMRRMVSTIPPRKDFFGDRPFVLNNIAALNRAISDLAAELGIGFVDTHGAFMAANPPDGWRALLEDVGGNHPSPAGHSVIAGLFSQVLAAYPPLVPGGVERDALGGPDSRRFQWNPGCESDISHYRVEFGPSPNVLGQTLITVANRVELPGFPSEDVYFRLQAVDTTGHAGEFSRVFTTAERPRAGRRVQHPVATDRPKG